MISEPLQLTPADLPRYYKTINVAQCARQEICVALMDRKNRSVSLSNKDSVKNEQCADDECETGDNADNPGFPDGIEPKEDWPDVCVRMVARAGYQADVLFDVQGTVTDFDNGIVVFHLTEKQTTEPGMYLAEIGLFRGEYLMTRWPVYVVIEPSVFAGNTRAGVYGGMITVPEIRLLLRDTMPEDNYLLDEREFSDVEILTCMRRPIDYWNGIRPPDRELTYQYNKFPEQFRHFFLQGAMGYVLEIAAADYRRNSIPTTAGGIQLADREKWTQYDNRSRELLQEFQTWARETKYGMSMGLATGAMLSPYRYRQF